MTDLHGIQRHVVARIGQRPVGSASRFALMDAADAIGGGGADGNGVPVLAGTTA